VGATVCVQALPVLVLAQTQCLVALSLSLDHVYRSLDRLLAPFSVTTTAHVPNSWHVSRALDCLDDYWLCSCVAGTANYTDDDTDCELVRSQI
jgi:hypothetical protein